MQSSQVERKKKSGTHETKENFESFPKDFRDKKKVSLYFFCLVGSDPQRMAFQNNNKNPTKKNGGFLTFFPGPIFGFFDWTFHFG